MIAPVELVTIIWETPNIRIAQDHLGFSKYNIVRIKIKTNNENRNKENRTQIFAWQFNNPPARGGPTPHLEEERGFFLP